MHCKDDFWTEAAKEGAKLAGTPCYVFSWPHVLSAMEELLEICSPFPVKHWLSLKTQPLRRLAEAWRSRGAGVEVVSAFELELAIKAGFAPEDILVNGPAKHTWLKNWPLNGLRVNFDSLGEAQLLSRTAKQCNWHIGLRFAPRRQFDPDEPRFGTQFGLNRNEVVDLVKILESEGMRPEVAHFHLRSNVPNAIDYLDAIDEVASICEEAGFMPRVLDCGGGLHCPGEHEGLETILHWPPADLSFALAAIEKKFPQLEEIWFENGRFLTGRAGVLVLSVVDVKERDECRYLICDGGRTNHAIVSDWERHRLITIPERCGTTRLTTVCGPSCMAFDRLCRLELPSDVENGDLVVWCNAGAYHIPWETRFSHGLAPIVWVDENYSFVVIRDRENFKTWSSDR